MNHSEWAPDRQHLKPLKGKFEQQFNNKKHNGIQSKQLTEQKQILRFSFKIFFNFENLMCRRAEERKKKIGLNREDKIITECKQTVEKSNQWGEKKTKVRSKQKSEWRDFYLERAANTKKSNPKPQQKTEKHRI